MEPVQPVLRGDLVARGCRGRAGRSTVTLVQSIVPSSGSLTVTWNGTVSPKENSCPATGWVRFTVGAVLPDVTTRLAVPVSPSGP